MSEIDIVKVQIADLAEKQIVFGCISSVAIITIGIVIIHRRIDKHINSKNAVLTQIWITLCVYLRIAFLKFQSKLNKSMQQILRLLDLNLFEKRDLMVLLRGEQIGDGLPDINQMVLL